MLQALMTGSTVRVTTCLVYTQQERTTYIAVTRQRGGAKYRHSSGSVFVSGSGPQRNVRKQNMQSCWRLESTTDRLYKRLCTLRCHRCACPSHMQGGQLFLRRFSSPSDARHDKSYMNLRCSTERNGVLFQYFVDNSAADVRVANGISRSISARTRLMREYADHYRIFLLFVSFLFYVFYSLIVTARCVQCRARYCYANVFCPSVCNIETLWSYKLIELLRK